MRRRDVYTNCVPHTRVYIFFCVSRCGTRTNFICRSTKDRVDHVRENLSLRLLLKTRAFQGSEAYITYEPFTGETLHASRSGWPRLQGTICSNIYILSSSKGARGNKRLFGDESQCHVLMLPLSPGYSRLPCYMGFSTAPDPRHCSSVKFRIYGDKTSLNCLRVNILCANAVPIYLIYRAVGYQGLHSLYYRRVYVVLVESGPITWHCITIFRRVISVS